MQLDNITIGITEPTHSNIVQIYEILCSWMTQEASSVYDTWRLGRLLLRI
jgi:hypothetical protein